MAWIQSLGREFGPEPQLPGLEDGRPALHRGRVGLEARIPAGAEQGQAETAFCQPFYLITLNIFRSRATIN